MFAPPALAAGFVEGSGGSTGCSHFLLTCLSQPQGSMPAIREGSEYRCFEDARCGEKQRGQLPHDLLQLGYPLPLHPLPRGYCSAVADWQFDARNLQDVSLLQHFEGQQHTSSVEALLNFASSCRLVCHSDWCSSLRELLGENLGRYTHHTFCSNPHNGGTKDFGDSRFSRLTRQ